MKLIPKENYYSEAIFQKEMKTLFDTHFQFGAFTDELTNDRDFVCVDFYGTSAVIQNFKGVIKAFQNVCTHRFNKIQTEDKGNRPLMCAYHGWTYDAAGTPIGIPKKSQFIKDDEDSKLLCLPEYIVEICGKFVFFKKHDDGIGLRQHLGDEYYGLLETLSAQMGKQVYFGTVPHAANWKLIVENVVECYHCAVVHQNTFMAKMGIGGAPLEKVSVYESHSSCHFPRTPVKNEKMRVRLLSHLADRGMNHDSFYHIHIFPNLFLASSEGIFFYIGHPLPVAPDKTNMRIRYFSINAAIPENRIEIQDIINKDGIEMGLAVVEEDRAILENIQKAIPLSERPGTIGDDEVRIKAFMEQYLNLMS